MVSVMSAWYRFDETNFSKRQFVGVWVIATPTYGTGDILTTLSLWSVPHLVEANWLMAAAVGQFGHLGIIAVKLAVFAIALTVSIRGIHTEDSLSVYFPPAVLSIIGAFTTVYNLRLLLG